MRFLLTKSWFVVALLPAMTSLCAAGDPVVENVSFYQRTDGSGELVIGYDVYDPDGDTLDITITGGTEWNQYLVAETISGDVGPGIVPGPGKVAIWSFGADCSICASDEFVVRVTANDGYELYCEILQGTDPFNPDDTHIYPYYRVFRPGGEVAEFAFAEGDTVPHRAQVVFKLLGWEGDATRSKSRPLPDDLYFQARYEAVGIFRESAPFPFASQYSELHRTEAWETAEGSADTISFLAGPFAYQLSARVTDGGPLEPPSTTTFSFHSNSQPQVQCVVPGTPGTPPEQIDEPCPPVVETIYCSYPPTPPPNPDWIPASLAATDQIWYSLEQGKVWLERPFNPIGVDSVPAVVFHYELRLYGADHPRDRLFDAAFGGDPRDRIFSWRYEIVSEADPTNAYPDGAGFDDLSITTYEFGQIGDPIFIDSSGIWIMQIDIRAPILLAAINADVYLAYLVDFYGDLDLANAAFELTTLPFGNTTGRFIARDSSIGEVRPDHCAYHCYRQVRVPEPHGEACEPIYEGILSSFILDDFSIASEMYEKSFAVVVNMNSGGIFPLDR